MSYTNDSFFKRTKNYWPPLLLFLLINLASISALWNLQSLEKQYQLFDAASQAQDVEIRLNIRYDSLIAAAMSLGDRIVEGESISQEKLNIESQLIRSYFSGFQAINFVNKDKVIEFVTPYESNSAAVGRDLKSHSIVAPLLNEASAKTEMKLTPPVELYQGGLGLVFYYPLNENGTFIGWLNIVFKIDSTMDNLFIAEEFKRYDLVVRDVESNKIIYHEKSLLAENAYDFSKHYFYQFPFFGRVWEVGLLRERVSPISIFGNASFLLILCLSALLAALLKIYLDRVDQVTFSLKDALSETMLLRVLCHDLSSPLTMANFLIDKVERHSDEKGLQVINELRQSLTIQADMLENIRELQLYKKGSKQMSLVPVSLNAAYFQAKRVFAKKLEEKKIELVADFDQTKEWSILSHKICFENNIFNNLISNALKYSNRGSSIKIRFIPSEQDMQIEISDNGVGITPQARSAFEQGEALPSLAGTEGETGSGFGLVLVKSFVELTRGKIKIKESKDGTTFTLIYPMA